jgi:hypothetical protein
MASAADHTPTVASTLPKPTNNLRKGDEKNE